jgi:methyl-accepting chemotaxis protein
MEEIVGAVQRVTDIMAEISAASKEQSTGIEQVNVAITQMDKMTQQNAALVEEAAAAAKSMEEQTEGLGSMVSAFTLPPEMAVAAAPPPRSHAPASRADQPTTRRVRQAAASTDDDTDWTQF